jgi:hypothetical protein
MVDGVPARASWAAGALELEPVLLADHVRALELGRVTVSLFPPGPHYPAGASSAAAALATVAAVLGDSLEVVTLEGDELTAAFTEPPGVS